jgi:hypothetical protein
MACRLDHFSCHFKDEETEPKLECDFRAGSLLSPGPCTGSFESTEAQSRKRPALRNGH